MDGLEQKWDDGRETRVALSNYDSYLLCLPRSCYASRIILAVMKRKSLEKKYSSIVLPWLYHMNPSTTSPFPELSTKKARIPRRSNSDTLHAQRSRSQAVVSSLRCEYQVYRRE